MKIAYLGPEGSYSQEAAQGYTKKKNLSVCTFVPCSGFSEVIQKVETGQSELGVLPVENSTYGAVATAMDLLLHLDLSTVIDEYVLDIHNNFLGTTKDAQKIQYVYSHEQAIEQCYRFFEKHYPHIEFIRCPSTTQACILAQKGGEQYGAVAGKRAAHLYGLHILHESIQDNAFNQTRFQIISQKAPSPSGNDKTSIVFSTHADTNSGSLFDILKALAEQQINLTRIESRPAKSAVGNYIFYIDFIGHQQDITWKKAYEQMKPNLNWIKIIGSYPIFQK